MALEQCRPVELHGQVHQAPVALFVELARVREPDVRNTSRAARRRHSHAVNYRVHVSKAHMPDRNHLDALRALQASAVRHCRFRWARKKQWTSGTDCELACRLLAFRRYGTQRSRRADRVGQQATPRTATTGMSGRIPISSEESL